MTTEKIHGTEEAWESGALGLDERYVAVDPEQAATEALIEQTLGLKPISIRLDASLIEDFKMLGEIEGIGYQTLMRTVLRRFAEAEIKHLAHAWYEQRRLEQEQASSPDLDKSQSTPSAKRAA
jgi:uncharacterized protein (DUF4415 family)